MGFTQEYSLQIYRLNLRIYAVQRDAGAALLLTAPATSADIAHTFHQLDEG